MATATPTLLAVVLLTACNGPSLPFECGVGIRECGFGKAGLYDYDGDGYCEDVDCEELSCDINPGAAETCDGIDNDCDGFIDGLDKGLKYEEGEAFEYIVDYDGDSQCSESGDTVRMCGEGDGYLWDYGVPYEDERHGSIYVCRLKAGEADDMIDECGGKIDKFDDECSYWYYSHFDCCDQSGEDGCTPGYKPECTYSEVDSDFNLECAAYDC